MTKLKAFVLLFLSLFLFRDYLTSQQENVSSDEIKVMAHYWDKSEERIFARGNVEVHYKNITLFADEVEVNTETKDVRAWGNVTIRLPEEVVSCGEVWFNLDSSEGELKKDVFGQIQPTIFYQAESITRKNEDVYSLEKAKITSCTQPVPRWRFSCSRAHLKKDDYMDMWNAVFRIKSIPVFYLPYMRYPLREERATGLLIPQLGYSGQKGVYFSQSFYWNIQRNMDATLNLDYYLDRGLGSGLEYRYLFSEGTGGRLNLYYFRFNNRAPVGSQDNAYIVRMKHNQSLPLDFRIVADVDYQSSYDFLREFDNNFRRAVVSHRRSQVYLSRAWSYFNFNMRFSRFETYFKKLDNSVIRKNVPQIGFSSSKMKIFSPLYFSFSSAFNSWEYGWESAYQAGTQKKSSHLSFRPVIALPFTSIPWITVNSSFSAHLNYYLQSYAPGTKTIVDEPILSHNYSANFEFIGPVFYKIYYGAQDTPKLKHVIEPSFSYRYESPVGLSDRIITQRFFYLNHYARYGLTNRFYVNKGGQPKEVLSLGLSQVFYFSPEDSPLSRYRVEGEIPRFSDISGALRFYPAAQYSIDFSAAFNPYYRTFSRLRLGASLGSLNDSLFLRVNWYKGVNPYRKTALRNRHQISFFGGAKIPRLSLEGQVELDFNIIEKEMLYSAFALVYHYQCIDFRGELKIFYFRDKPEARFMFSFGLGNIGKTTDFLGGVGF